MRLGPVADKTADKSETATPGEANIHTFSGTCTQVCAAENSPTAANCPQAVAAVWDAGHIKNARCKLKLD